MTGKHSFLPVDTFSLLLDECGDGTLRGLAAPVAGAKPCAIALVAGATVVSVAQAGGFSDDALAQRTRLGWCAFAIGGLHQALALGGDVQVRCFTSDRLLHQWKSHELALILRTPATRRLTFSQLRLLVNSDGGCIDYRQVLPFAEHLGRVEGKAAVVRASYLYLLRRSADSEGIVDNVNFSSIDALWMRFMESEEFRLADYQVLPGPFDPGFPFPLEAMDLLDATSAYPGFSAA